MDEKKPSRYVLEGAAGDPGLRNAGERDRIRAIVRQGAGIDEYEHRQRRLITPTTELVRHNWGAYGAPAEEFDLWLAERDRVVAANAWDEGAREVLSKLSVMGSKVSRNQLTNPYRITEENN